MIAVIYRPFQTGFRFSRKAVMPSRASSVAKRPAKAAGNGDLAAAAERHAVDRRQGDLRQRLQLAGELLPTGGPGAAAVGGEFGDVGAGGEEALTGAGDDEDTDVGVGARLGDRIV